MRLLSCFLCIALEFCAHLFPDKPTLEEIADIPLQVFGEQYTAKCRVIANPLPVCKWTREVFDLGGNESVDRLYDN